MAEGGLDPSTPLISRSRRHHTETPPFGSIRNGQVSSNGGGVFFFGEPKVDLVLFIFETYRDFLVIVTRNNMASQGVLRRDLMAGK